MEHKLSGRRDRELEDRLWRGHSKCDSSQEKVLMRTRLNWC